jgi:predicted nucleotidyltransferase component of viral defense system
MLHLSTIDTKVFKLLKEVFTIPEIKKKFGLAGGTSLALQIGHRKSIDLDIFSPEKISVDETENLLAAHKSWKYEPIGKLQTMLFCHINSIKCDFVNEPFALLNPFNEEQGVSFYSLADIAAMKMHTICGRGKKKDFFDVYVLIELFGWQQMLKWFELKYGNSQLFFLWKSISYFEDAEEDVDIIGFPPYTKNWDEVKEYIKKNCR